MAFDFLRLSLQKAEAVSTMFNIWSTTGSPPSSTEATNLSTASFAARTTSKVVRSAPAGAAG
eukprot:5343489-Alexandrium_andersonii.AAC.1